MKLIYPTTARIPTEKAHGLATMKLCEALARAGIEVKLVCPWRFNKIEEDPFDYYKIERNFNIKRLPHLDFVPLDKLLGPLASWIGFLEFSFSLFCYALIKGFLKSDVIFFSHNHFPLFVISFFSDNVFYDVHDFPRLKDFFYKLYFQTFFKRLKGIVVTNSWKKKELRDIFSIEDDKIIIFPNGVDIEKFDIKESREDCRKKLGLSTEKKIVLYTGHLFQWKGVDTLALASQFLPPNIEIYFVGGTERDIKKFRVKYSSLKVNAVGHRPHSEIPFWLKSADVLVLPNTAKEDISKYWTSPMKMLEYMASKRPIITSNLPSIREILSENNSILVDPDSPNGLARGVMKALENSDLSETISNQAFLDVQRFTWENRAEKILSFIKNKKV